MLEVGQKAPAFQGINQNGETISLEGLHGKRVILYFYPKDNTPGCTAEACSLNDKNDYFINKGFVIVGVSPDSTESHRKFASTFNLAFHLLADSDKAITCLWCLGRKTRQTYMACCVPPTLFQPTAL